MNAPCVNVCTIPVLLCNKTRVAATSSPVVPCLHVADSGTPPRFPRPAGVRILRGAKFVHLGTVWDDGKGRRHLHVERNPVCAHARTLVRSGRLRNRNRLAVDVAARVRGETPRTDRHCRFLYGVATGGLTLTLYASVCHYSPGDGRRRPPPDGTCWSVQRTTVFTTPFRDTVYNPLPRRTKPPATNQPLLAHFVGGFRVGLWTVPRLSVVGGPGEPVFHRVPTRPEWYWLFRSIHCILEEGGVPPGTGPAPIYRSGCFYADPRLVLLYSTPSRWMVVVVDTLAPCNDRFPPLPAHCLSLLRGSLWGKEIADAPSGSRG